MTVRWRLADGWPAWGGPVLHIWQAGGQHGEAPHCTSVSFLIKSSGSGQSLGYTENNSNINVHMNELHS